MTIDDLVKVFRSKAWPIPMKDGGEGSDREGVIAIVRALRDETRHMTLNRDSLEELFTQILGDAGEMVAGGLPDDAVPIPLMHPESAISAPATDAAPAHEWFQFSNLVACRACGVVRRADDKNSPCKGPVRVALRDTDAAPAVCVWTKEGHWYWQHGLCSGKSNLGGYCPACGKPIKFTEAK